ncbi:MAG: hypothetical protein FWH55_11490 [Oscillospiraceae bacterium]|nr:hypothetical protein [Oscillospiraceae bacterium]
MSKSAFIRVAALVIAISMCMTLLTGCTENEMSLIKALLETKPIYSYEAASSLEFSLNVVPNKKAPDSYSKDFMETLFRVLGAYLDGAKLDMSVKVGADKDYESIKEEIIITPTIFGGLMKDLSVGMWLDAKSGDVDDFNMYFKMPRVVSALSKETAGKDYLTMNLGSILEFAGDDVGADFSGIFDFKKLTENSAGLMKPVSDVIIKAASQMKPDEIYVRGVRKVVDEYGKMGRVYMLKISDSGFKKLLRSAINDIDKETAKELLFAVLDASIESIENFSTASDIYEEMLSEMEIVKVVLEDEFDQGYDDIVSGINEFLDTVKRVKILGPKGITVDIGVDYNGYITMWDGIVDFAIDVERIDQLMGGDYPPDISRVDFSIKFYQKMSKINQTVNIEMPEITKENSISFDDLMISLMEPNSYYNDDFINNSDFGDWNEAWDSVEGFSEF